MLRKPIDPEELLESLERALATTESEADVAGNWGTARHARGLYDMLRRVSELLAQSTDMATQLVEVSRALVPACASACVVERVDMAASLREVLCTQHESAALDSELHAWACRPDWLSQVIGEVVESGKPRLLDLQEEADLSALRGVHADIASARALGFESVVVVPMIARRRLFGIVTCASRASRRYGESDVAAFAELGHRLALALDNAALTRMAQEAQSDHDELLRALSCELQAPLATLTELAVQALDRAEVPGARKFAESVAHETRRLHAQLRELIELGAVRSGSSQLRVQEIELVPRLRRVLERTRKTDVLGRMSWTVDEEVDGLHVSADPERIDQAFALLLQAALAESPDEGRIEVDVSRSENDLLVTLLGCSAQFASEFEASGDVASAGYAAGNAANLARTRRGLRLARTLIELQGGRLWGDQPEDASRVGEVCRVGLPLCATHPLTNTDPPPSETVILLVDSDLAFRRELQEILGERGYTVRTADNGLQAWQYLQAHAPPALILFDLVLPAMDGWELHAAIKSDASLQWVPAVIVSGLDRYRIEASLPDAHGYIEKPIRSAQLFEVVQRHVVNPARPRTMSVRPSSCL